MAKSKYKVKVTGVDEKMIVEFLSDSRNARKILGECPGATNVRIYKNTAEMPLVSVARVLKTTEGLIILRGAVK